MPIPVNLANNKRRMQEIELEVAEMETKANLVVLPKINKKE